MAKLVTPEMLLEQRLASVVRQGLRVHGISPDNLAYDIGVAVALGVYAAFNDCRVELGWTPPAESGDRRWEWSYRYPDTGPIGRALTELQARREAARDLSVILLRREPGATEWEEAPA